MPFKDIKGQDRAILFLKGALENKKVAHAYIFLGPSGIGKKLVAFDFAKALNCDSYELNIANTPCGTCLSCRKIESSNHPDILFVRPEKEGASIKIDMIRQVIRDSGIKPYEGRKKVYIIDDADYMTEEASNALLKTLEAPPSDSVLILITGSLDALLDTIVSRSQVVRFFPLGINVAADLLEKQYSIDSVKARILAHMTCGCLGEALSRSKDESFFNTRANIIAAMINRSFFDLDLENVARGDLKRYLDIMLSWYRDILVRKTGAGKEVLINIDQEDAIMKEARVLDWDHIDKVITQIIMSNSFLDRNANPKLVMSALQLTI